MLSKANYSLVSREDDTMHLSSSPNDIHSNSIEAAASHSKNSPIHGIIANSSNNNNHNKMEESPPDQEDASPSLRKMSRYGTNHAATTGNIFSSVISQKGKFNSAQSTGNLTFVNSPKSLAKKRLSLRDDPTFIYLLKQDESNLQQHSHHSPTTMNSARSSRRKRKIAPISTTKVKSSSASSDSLQFLQQQSSPWSVSSSQSSPSSPSSVSTGSSLFGFGCIPLGEKSSRVESPSRVDTVMQRIKRKLSSRKNDRTQNSLSLPQTPPIKELHLGVDSPISSIASLYMDVIISQQNLSKPVRKQHQQQVKRSQFFEAATPKVALKHFEHYLKRQMNHLAFTRLIQHELYHNLLEEVHHQIKGFSPREDKNRFILVEIPPSMISLFSSINSKANGFLETNSNSIILSGTQLREWTGYSTECIRKACRTALQQESVTKILLHNHLEQYTSVREIIQECLSLYTDNTVEEKKADTSTWIRGTPATIRRLYENDRAIEADSRRPKKWSLLQAIGKKLKGLA